MARVDRLVVENYRGASTRLQLDFEKDKNVVLIFGENGTGKTTIADALDALGNSSKGSLEDRSSTRARAHLPTIGRKPADVRIEVTTSSGSWLTALAGDNLTTSPPGQPKIRVLRRSQLQRLIQAEPAKRYEELRHFIDVDAVERAEDALKGAVSDVNTSLTSESSKRVETETQLQQAWESEGKPGADAITWARQAASQDAVALANYARQLREVQDANSRANTTLAELKEAENGVAKAKQEALQVEQEIGALPGIDARQAVSLTAVLNHVAQHLAVGVHSDVCPVCSQAISLKTLTSDIQRRLGELKKYDSLRVKTEAAVNNVNTAGQWLNARRDSLLVAAKALLSISQKAEIPILSGISANAYQALAKQPLTDLSSATVQAQKLIEAFSPYAETLSAAEATAAKQSGQVNLIAGLYKQAQKSIAASEGLAKLQPSLKKAYDLARLTRIEFTQKILDSVATECNRLYAFIHPHEPIAISKLALDVGKRASLNQAASFEGYNDVPPQAYFSDSHLDTLGFCFWLATAKRESAKADVVVVLDDVFVTADTAHLTRIAQLITDESKYFGQIIATTHQRLWRDIYRYQHGAGKLTQTIELQRWTLAKGISNHNTRLAVDDLAASIAAAPFDRQITASRAGILLEAILDYLARQYRCRVALTNDGSYTLGELLDGTESLFKKLEVHRPELDSSGKAYLPPKYSASTPAAVMRDIRSLAFLRNQVGAHFNVSGAAVADSEIQRFAELTVKLAEALSCATCGQVPGKKGGTHFQCSCTAPNEVRLLPLQH